MVRTSACHAEGREFESRRSRHFYLVIMFYTYVIYSELADKYYIGHTHDLGLRLIRHNEGWTHSTKFGIPWKLVYSETYQTKSEAMKREYEIKRMKSSKYIEDLINK